ncbi:KIR-like protein [Plasmodium coatneyi]|uniref:KIR-like protein n=1 Tax=Plasmodium coatneyi TaxID=208452 RepID=A0A1B1DZG6_9APIC|nr:KIR-like protein [Plasmodium coatneyi]ANQ08191.1 KIR-like protein [Plasmodium coatneyi]
MSAVQLDRQNLPSYIKFYKQFDESNVECKSGCDNNITNVTDRCKGNKCNVTIDRIKKALGYIYHECGKDKTPSKEEAYHFFYYWLGDKLSKSEEGRANFLAEIGLICDAINDSCTSGQKCGIPRDNPEPSTFDSQKKIFDYYYDYSRIKENLKNGEPNCHDSWSSYRAEVSLACDVVKEYCAGKGKDDEKAYCEEFKTKYLPYCTMAKLSELTCELTSTQQRIVSAATLAVSSKANEAVSKATTTASLTSSMVASKYNHYKYIIIIEKYIYNYN